MPAPRATLQSYRPVLVLAGMTLVVTILYVAQAVIIPLALASLFAFILSPAVMVLQRRGGGRVISVLVVVLLAVVVLGGIGATISLQVRSLARDLPQHKHHIADKLKGLLNTGQGGFLDEIRGTFQDITNEVLESQKNEGRVARDEPVPVKLQRSPVSQLQEAVTPAAEFLATAGMVLVLVIFILIKREDLRNRLVRLIGHGRLIVTTRAIDEAAQRISRYLLMQLMINTGFGAALGIGLAAIGVPYALLWGFIAGAFRFVPYVGTWVAASLIAIFAVAIFPDWTRPLMVFGLFGLIEVLTFNVVEPLLFGHSTGISSVALLVAAAFWTWLWGPIGLVLSTPLTACLVVLGKYVRDLQFFSILLGDEPVLDAEVTYYQRLLARDPDEATELVEEHLQSQPAETVYDEVLVPALVLAKRDREGGDLGPEEEEFILRVTTDLLNDLVLPQQQIHVIATKGLPEVEELRALVLACPARDEEDELAVRMLAQLVSGAPCRFEVLAHETLAGELLERIQREKPTLVCIGALPPGGQTLTRYLCKRLRQRFPDLRIFVGCWGQGDDLEETRARLLAAGATAVAGTLLESREQITPLVQAAHHGQPPGEKLEPAGHGV